MVAFNPPIRPSAGTQVRVAPKIRAASFGDGYEQRVPDGLNHIRRKVSLRWDGLTEAQKNAIENFFVERGGYKKFTYRLFGESVDRQWKCEDWTISPEVPFKMTASFVEVFEP